MTLRHYLFVVLGCVVLAGLPLSAQICKTPPVPGIPPCVLTSQYDNLRDGLNNYELLLSSTGLSAGTVTLSKPAWSPLRVDTDDLPPGQNYNPVYAQPLYVSQMNIGGIKHNAVIAVTLNGTIYTWDGDNGALLWKRKGTTGPKGTNSLWFDDCGPKPGMAPKVDSLPFAGILSTPVIDVSGTVPVMFTTSYCQTSTGTKEWWIHEVNLTTGADISTLQVNGSVPGNADGRKDNTVVFEASAQIQRPALLEVRLPGANPNPLIYAAFGTAVVEDYAASPYHGWIFGFTIDTHSVLHQVFTFATTPTGRTGDTGNPPCADTVQDGYQNAANWCGQGGGIWMSGRGPASTTMNGVAHSYFGVGNGGFQTGGLNWGESILDFQLSASGASATPDDSFTPYGGRYLSPPLDNGVPYVFQSLNENDWDMSPGGVLLFQDGKGIKRAVTMDKAGYGYVLTPGHLGGFKPGDPGNAFSFGAAQSLCTLQAYQCDRVVSMAFYNDTLYFWPDHERLFGVKSYNSTTALPGTGTITSAGTSITGTGTDFPHQIVPGNTLTVAGQRVVVTGMPGSNTTLTVTPALNPDVTNATFSYNGLFVNPMYSSVPNYLDTGYPGGSLVVTGQGSAPGSGIVWAIGTAHGVTQTARGPGTLYAYDAATLTELWSSPDAFTASSFALPTIVNGSIYIPTYDQGILVYKGSRH